MNTFNCRSLVQINVGCLSNAIHERLPNGPNTSFASRCMPGAAGFLTFSQQSARPEGYGEPTRFDKMPSQPSWQACLVDDSLRLIRVTGFPGSRRTTWPSVACLPTGLLGWKTHHDAIEFPDGRTVMLTHLCEGQAATVLQLPAQPATAAEADAQKRVTYVG